MYPFHTLSVAGFKLAYSSPSLGEKHLKRFIEPGVTPLNQATMNLYLSGEFRFEIGAFSQRLVAGQTSDNLVITEFPVGELCTEQPLVAGSRRLCVSALDGARWQREVLVMPQGNVAVVLEGALALVLAGRLAATDRQLAAGDFAVGGQTLTALTPCKVVLASFPA